MQIAVEASYEIEPPVANINILNALSQMKVPLRGSQLKALGSIFAD